MERTERSAAGEHETDRSFVSQSEVGNRPEGRCVDLPSAVGRRELLPLPARSVRSYPSRFVAGSGSVLPGAGFLFRFSRSFASSLIARSMRPRTFPWCAPGRPPRRFPTSASAARPRLPAMSPAIRVALALSLVSRDRWPYFAAMPTGPTAA